MPGPAIGNSFNGMQTFASLTRHRFVWAYMALTVCMIFEGPLLEVKLMWDIADVVLALVAIPNIIGILILASRNPEVIRYRLIATFINESSSKTI